MSTSVKYTLARPLEAIMKPKYVTYMRFNGWSSAVEIFLWLAEHGHRSYYVPEGYEHGLRTPSEHDTGNGHLNPSAESFLALYLGETWIRVNFGYLIVMSDDGSLSVMNQTTFSKNFENPA